MSSDRTPEEKGRNLELFVEAAKLEKEAKELGTKTKAEVEASIAGKGHDREKARELGRRAAEAFAKAEAQEQAQPQAPAQSGDRKAPARVIPLRPRAVPLYARVAAAATLLGPVGFLALNQAESLTLVASGQDGGAETLEAEALRSEAANALEARQWARCIALLDEAKKKDPKGDLAPAVQDVRRIAMRKLGRVDASGPE